jgi:leukotriene-A4 hydrolase
VTKHIRLAWNVDFVNSKIWGTATLSMVRIGKEKLVKLDCSHLNVKCVTDVKSGQRLQFTVDPQATKFGGLLAVDLMSSEDSAFDLQIEYETTEKCSALQWLRPEQTVGKVHPYLFSQCQAIHARSMLPCQDTPAIKATYNATVTLSAPLAAVMSANKRRQLSSVDGMHTFDFEQTLPIPSYLIAIGAGAITSKEIGPRSAVWCEKEILEAAAFEFAETESFITTAEQLVGKYVWERYDILLLPPSFPYGGMENPCLTFLTPSLLCGDRSLVDVVAHEISHSWTGNLVSCMNWEHFWLNEGFTMFLERKILAKLHGEGWRQFNSHIGLADLRESVAQFGGDGPETALIPDLSNTDPDDVFSSVPYEKGYTLLYVLEELVGGGTIFEPFFKAHIQHHAGKSITSEEFKTFLFDYFKDDVAITSKLTAFEWSKWLQGRGMPPTIPKYSEEMLTPCRQLAQAWIQTGKSDAVDFGSFSPAQKTMFLDLLLLKANQLDPVVLETLNNAYHLSESKNVEVLLKWYLICIRNKNEAFFEAAAKFATQHGRMKYCRPILRELYKSGEVGRKIALTTFERNKSFYHPIAAQMIAKDLSG